MIKNLVLKILETNWESEGGKVSRGRGRGRAEYLLEQFPGQGWKDAAEWNKQQGDPLAEYIRLKFISVCDGTEIYIRIRMTTTLGRVKESFATRLKVPTWTLRFFFDGRRINYDDTPGQLKMEEDDIIEFYVEQDWLGCS